MPFLTCSTKPVARHSSRYVPSPRVRAFHPTFLICWAPLPEKSTISWGTKVSTGFFGVKVSRSDVVPMIVCVLLNDATWKQILLYPTTECLNISLRRTAVFWADVVKMNFSTHSLVHWRIPHYQTQHQAMPFSLSLKFCSSSSCFWVGMSRTSHSLLRQPFSRTLPYSGHSWIVWGRSRDSRSSPQSDSLWI